MKKRNFSVLIFCLLLAALAYSCQSNKLPFTEPRVSLDTVDISNITMDGIELLAFIDVENPNGYPIPIPKVDWELFINRAPFIDGVLKDSKKTIQAKDSITMTVPVVVPYDSLTKVFTNLLLHREAAYKLDLDLSFPLPLIRDKVYRLSFSDALPLPNILNF